MADWIKAVGKSLVSEVITSRRRWLTAREAKQALASLERDLGPLPAILRRRAREDAVERLGSERHALWLSVYAAVARDYRDGWLPDSYFRETVIPRINGISHHIGRIRATNPIFFDAVCLPDLLYVLNGRILDSEHQSMTAEAGYDLLRGSGVEVIFKADHSGFGLGVKTVRTADLVPDALSRFSNGVFQKKLGGHASFRCFGVDALTTLRIGTVLPEFGAPEVRNCYLKIGRAGHRHVLARDQFRVAVDWTSGELDARGFLSNWTCTGKHPDSGAPLAGMHVPHVDRAVALVTRLHARIPLPRYVSWDLAIGVDEELHVLEWEGGVASFAEAVQGPCFADLGWDIWR